MGTCLGLTLHGYIMAMSNYRHGRQEQNQQGGWLSDKHMDFAQAIVSSIIPSIFKNLTGSQSILTFGTQATTSIPPSVQIVHTQGNHWIVVTTLGSPFGSPKLFNSLYETIDQPILLDLAHRCQPWRENFQDSVY